MLCLNAEAYLCITLNAPITAAPRMKITNRSLIFPTTASQVAAIIAIPTTARNVTVISAICLEWNPACADVEGCAGGETFMFAGGGVLGTLVS